MSRVVDTQFAHLKQGLRPLDPLTARATLIPFFIHDTRRHTSICVNAALCIAIRIWQSESCGGHVEVSSAEEHMHGKTKQFCHAVFLVC